MSNAATRGHVDGLQGPFIVGWAFNTSGVSCEISVIDETGEAVATGLASIERPDLAALEQGRSNFAFQILLPALNGRDTLRVLADGAELANSPLRVGAGTYDGTFDINRGNVEGWVAERLNDFAPPIVTIQDQDGNVVFEGSTEITTIPGSDHLVAARFGGAIANLCFGRGELHLSAFADGYKFAEKIIDLPLVGHLETITAERCSGWLASAAAPHRAMEIDIFMDGDFITTVTCNIPREDVNTVVSGATRAGFDASLPALPAQSDEVTTISLRLHGSDKDLFDSPYILGTRPALISAARNVARLAHGEGNTRLTAVEQSVLNSALADFVEKARGSDRLMFDKQPRKLGAGSPRFNVIIPIYRDVEITRNCILSVIEHRSEQHDRIVLINDRSPDAEMDAMLRSFLTRPNIFLLNNSSNLGFVKSVNRGISFCNHGDVILLNSDTRVFAGGLEELWRVAHASPDIGTVTAMSNNATIFSYPHATLRTKHLDDIGWDDLAALTLEKNAGAAIDVPTGHGFCMLVKQEVLRRIGRLDEEFGRGYGEENDFCIRASDFGYRNVFAPGAFVMHYENISFTGEKAGQLKANLPKLEKRYPEYTPLIIETERRDDFRRGRWALDAERLRRASDSGQHFALVVQNSLDGGTLQAISDIEEAAGYGDAKKIALRCRKDGYLELSAQQPLMRALFAPDEVNDLMRLLGSADIKLCVVHQLLGYSANFIATLGEWLTGRKSLFYVHDFYSACPRVTMLDALGKFCNVAKTDVCARCITIGKAHEASRASELTPAEHRLLFHRFLRKVTHIVAPSASAARNLKLAFPDLDIEVVPHPERAMAYPNEPKSGTDEEILLLGAIGPHKGSEKLVEIAQLARLLYPRLRFHVVGHTNRDEELRRLGNVSITGAYSAEELRTLISRVKGRLALFLSGWPETYSYTLSEVVREGFIPLVPNIGAMAERVRSAGFGVVFPFPFVAADVLDAISAISSGKTGITTGAATPNSFAPNGKPGARTKHLLSTADPATAVRPARRAPARTKKVPQL